MRREFKYSFLASYMSYHADQRTGMVNHLHNYLLREYVLDAQMLGNPRLTAGLKLWAIMLRNSNELFIAQSTSRKFLDTLEDLLSSSRTSPVVRERLLEVVAAAAFASGNSMCCFKSRNVSSLF